jgi:hypothetical protein
VRVDQPRLPSVAAKAPAPTGISAETLSRRIDEFLGSRGFKAEPDQNPSRVRPGSDPASVFAGKNQPGVRPGSDPGLTPLDFVCEEDVRLAIQTGRKLVVSERAIVTPSARDLGEANRVFTVAPWRG